MAMNPFHQLSQCFLKERTELPDTLLSDTFVDAAIRRGLGPILFWLAKDRLSDKETLAIHDRLLSADLSARVISSTAQKAVAEIATVAAEIGHSIVLLKGASTSLTTYPSPHLRTMGDIDLLCTQEALPEIDSILRSRGYCQRSTNPPEFYASHHHATPLFHPQRGIWIELHTALVRPSASVAHIPALSPASIFANLVTSQINGITVNHLRPELALIHTCVHMVDDVNWDRSIFALLDMALILRRFRAALNWPLIEEWLQNTPAFYQLDIVLSYLYRWELIDLPFLLTESRQSDTGLSDSILRRLLYGVIDQHVVGDDPFTLLKTGTNVQILWQTLFGHGSPSRKLATLPWNLLFPPDHPRRYSIGLLAHRARSALGYSKNR